MVDKVLVDKELIQQALDALNDHSGNYKLSDKDCDVQRKVITALELGLEQTVTNKALNALRNMKGKGYFIDLRNQRKV